MRSPRLASVGSVSLTWVLLAGGGLATVAAAPEEAPPQGAVFVTGSSTHHTSVYGSPSAGAGFERSSGRYGATESMSDPRVSGDSEWSWTLDTYSPGQNGVWSARARISNGDGAWTGTVSGMRYLTEAGAHATRITGYLIGEGDYEGWTYFIHRSDAGTTSVEGLIFPGQPPGASQGGDAAPEVVPPDVAPPLVAPPGAVLFDDFPGDTLAHWVGKDEGWYHSGTIADDPLDPDNKVLRLTEVIGAGDVFSRPIAVTPGQEYALCFDYLGTPVATAPEGNGGAIGIADGTPGNHRWLAGTAAVGGIEQDLLVDDGTWQHVRVEFYPEIERVDVGSFRIMLEDFSGLSGDVWFDNILLVPSDQDC